MKRKIFILALILSVSFFGGCGDNKSTQKPVSSQENKETPQAENTESNQTTKTDSNKESLSDGVYTAEFSTDSSMFHVSEACEGKGTLTVKDGEMTIHISLGSKKILNLFPGVADDAAKEGASLLSPTEDTVTYSDGTTEKVYGFDVPVPELDKEFDLALVGTKGKWYDHKVKVSNPVKSMQSWDTVQINDDGMPDDGTYSMEITFEGGSKKASILSPVTVVVSDGEAVATVEWTSPNYDYMLVDGEKYLPVNTDGNSVFKIPVATFDVPVDVVGDTTAMSKPHEVEYKITFHTDTMKKK